MAGPPVKAVVPFHDGPLELIAGPQCPVIQVGAWVTLLKEFPRVKNSVVGLKPEVTIRLPAHLRARTMPDETRVALSCGNNQRSRDGIHTVAQTLSPLKYPISGDSHAVRQGCFNMRVYVDKVNGARACGGEDTKIIALREQRIERTESVRPGIV